ncbi:MAG: lytic transglycosylase domain-containing protein [Rhodospirillales bacterium]|nr:lytic transglycosylase domain-containing protein [Rhodospirillales bacterium]
MSRTVLIVGLIAGLAASGSAWGTPVARQAIENPWKICASEAARQEAEFGLPRHLLAAVGKAESGRWDEANRANVAWPWTVTAEALAEVRRLKARKVANIDVGCMQVNLGYHGQRFFSVEEAMDPAVNTAYAARFLKSLRETSADWMEAAGRYHSSTPERNGPYRAKVARLWEETKSDEAKLPSALAAATARLAQGETPKGANLRNPVAGPRPFTRPSAVLVDHERTALLNSNFRAGRASDQIHGPGGESGASGAIVASSVDAAANRARIEADRTRAMKVRDAAPGTPAASGRFAAKRANDLNRWRATRPGGESY